MPRPERSGVRELRRVPRARVWLTGVFAGSEKSGGTGVTLDRRFLAVRPRSGPGGIFAAIGIHLPVRSRPVH